MNAYKKISIFVLLGIFFPTKLMPYMEANYNMLSLSGELAEILDPKVIEGKVLTYIKGLMTKKVSKDVISQALDKSLISAIHLGLNDLAVKLLKEGANANGQMNPPSVSPLSMAIDKHNLFMVVTLINAGAVVHPREIQLAEYWGYSDITLILKQYLDPKEQDYAGLRVEKVRNYNLNQ